MGISLLLTNEAMKWGDERAGNQLSAETSSERSSGAAVAHRRRRQCPSCPAERAPQRMQR